MITYALHGNLGSVDDWFAGDFFSGDAEEVDLWAEVNRGLGLEAWAGDFCARVAERQVGDDKPWLAGYSLGGRLALHALTVAPELWGGAVILSAHPGITDEKQRKLRLRKDAAWAEKARHGDWLEFIADWNSQAVLEGEGSVGFINRQRHLRSRRESIARAFELWSLGGQADLRDRIASCRLPILWLTGREDLKFTELGGEMAGRLQNGEHRVLEGCGHRILQEEPHLAAEAIRDFQKQNL